MLIRLGEDVNNIEARGSSNFFYLEEQLSALNDRQGTPLGIAYRHR